MIKETQKHYKVKKKNKMDVKHSVEETEGEKKKERKKKR